MWNLVKKIFVLSLVFLFGLTSCKKGTKVKQMPEYKSQTNFLTGGTSALETESKPQERVPQFNRYFASTSFDKNIDDIYFEDHYLNEDAIGCYIKTKPGITSKMYSRAGFEEPAYYVDDFKNGDLAVITNVYQWTDSEAACSIYIKILKLDNLKEGWVLYHPVHNRDFLVTYQSFNEFDKEYTIHNINARAFVSQRLIKPEFIGKRFCASKDNSKYALIKDESIFIYNYDNEKVYKRIDSGDSQFNFNKSSRIVFSNDQKSIYLVNKNAELIQFNFEEDKEEKLHVFENEEHIQFDSIVDFKISPDGRYLYVSGLMESAHGDIDKQVYGYDLERKEQLCLDLKKERSSGNYTLSDFCVAFDGAVCLTKEDDKYCVVRVFTTNGNEETVTGELDGGLYKIYEDAEINQVIGIGHSEDFIYARNNPALFSRDVSFGSQRETSFMVNYDPFTSEYGGQFVEVLYNQCGYGGEGMSSYIATYDSSNGMISIYSDVYTLLYSVKTFCTNSDVVWNGNKFYFINSDRKDIIVYTVDLVERPVKMQLAYNYDPDLAKMCSSQFLIFDGDDFNLYLRLSPQGMYSISSYHDFSGDYCNTIRGEYEFSGSNEVKLFAAGDTSIYCVEPEVIKQRFHDIPVLPDNENGWTSLKVEINFSGDYPRGWCDYWAK